jgi:hypothetical protein
MSRVSQPREGPSPAGLAVSLEVEAMLASGKAVVALESSDKDRLPAAIPPKRELCHT